MKDELKAKLNRHGCRSAIEVIEKLEHDKVAWKWAALILGAACIVVIVKSAVGG